MIKWVLQVKKDAHLETLRIIQGENNITNYALYGFKKLKVIKIIPESFQEKKEVDFKHMHFFEIFDVRCV